MDNCRWGIIGPGKISTKFADTVQYLEGSTLQAVASRDRQKAENFGGRFGAKKIYGSYLDLAKDPEVDAVYIGTPHSFHAEQAILCLDHGKAVLCEKPMALSASQVKRMIAASQKNNRFLMEAMWTRFLPATLQAEAWIKSGAIGELKYIRADFGFGAPFQPESRLYNMHLGGGALLDIGIYPLFLVLFLLGKPSSVNASAQLAPTGADQSCQAIFNFEDGKIATISCTLSCETSTSAEIAGTAGMIHIPTRWYRSHYLSLHPKDKEPLHMHLPHEHNGFEYQARELIRCVQHGLIESPMMSHSFSLQMAETMDEIRKQCGVHYPDEN